jgi:glutamyl-tRNA reductase
VAKIYNVFLYTIDDLARVAQLNTQTRLNEISAARAVLRDEMKDYFIWYDSLKIQPTLISLRRQFEEIRDEELSRYAGKLANLPPPAREILEAFARSLTNKFLHEPSRMLKEMSTQPDGLEAAETVAKLFNLKSGPHEP